ncbi:DUF2567 domain-containing protein [Umezawaea endophytica]|uniref:DUF2567 domain-containing protein n=1 Tax=Umezawaea endophytica TaxID=1654476 RepID=A0A9X3AF64_9PSEU|nr:DUF2567 domain-containing protein [Umezawaea endophytica]MCS7478322.1 DUF2567 domain-containing protein [Umezawaea endophytica]
MVEQPVDDRAVPVRIPPVLPQWVLDFHPRRPRVVVKRDLLPAVCLAGALSALALPLGWLWSRLAPGQNKVVQDGAQLIPVGGESYHALDALMVFVLLGLGAGLLTGIAVWLLRERRGPVIMLAAVLGSALAAYLGQKTGVGMAADHYAPTGEFAVGDTIMTAPALQTWWGVVAWPMATALAYGCLAAWNGMDDLGRRLG